MQQRFLFASLLVVGLVGCRSETGNPWKGAEEGPGPVVDGIRVQLGEFDLAARTASPEEESEADAGGPFGGVDASAEARSDSGGIPLGSPSVPRASPGTVPVSAEPVLDAIEEAEVAQNAAPRPRASSRQPLRFSAEDERSSGGEGPTIEGRFAGGGGGGYHGPSDSVPISGDAGGGRRLQLVERSVSTGSDDFFEGFGEEGEAAKKAKGEEDEPEVWQRATAVPNATTLRVGDGEVLPLTGMEVHAWVEGFRARVVMDCYYFNDRDQQLVGDFRLRLPEGGSPFYFAFGGSAAAVAADASARQPDFFSDDVRRRLGNDPTSILADRGDRWIDPKEARMVPKEQAAYAFLDTVRRQIDPALMEWSGAGVFNAQVFPLAPQKLHRVVVGYEVDLARDGEDLVYRLELPDGDMDLAVDLHVADGQPAAVSPDQRGVAAYGSTHYSWTRPEGRAFEVRLSGSGAAALTSPDGQWFAASFRPDLEGSGGVVEATSRSRRAVFAVDTSLSSADGRLPLWLDLFDAVLANGREEISEFAVLFFDVDPHWWRPRFSPNTPAASADLRAYAESLALEGATDLGAALAEVAAPSWSPAGERWDVFLLSDGAATWGEGDPKALARTLVSGRAESLFAYSTGRAGTDLRALDLLTRESGGAVFSVTGEADLAAASVAHRARPWRIEEVRLAGARDLLLAGRPRNLYPGQELRLAGRGRPYAGQEIELVLTQAGAARTVRTPIGHALESALAARAYGEIATGQLEELETWTAEAARAYATHFRVTGPTCSLLMLESQEDYERYGIVPGDDARLVQSTEASVLVAEAERASGGVLDDPKADFLAWLDRLEGIAQQVPDVSFEVGDEVRALLSDFTSADFDVPTGAAGIADRSLAGVPDEVREALAGGEPSYDLVQAEAERRRAERGAGDALRLVSSLVELNPGDAVFARDVAYSAVEAGLGGHAYHLFRRVAESRPFEPTTYPALARCLVELGRADLAVVWYEVAMAGRWPQRFGEFRRIAGLEYAHLLERIRRGEVRAPLARSFAAGRLAELKEELAPMRADLLVAIAWNTDRTDIDLHVLEPTGEHCYYSHRNTEIGGAMTQDVTQGYGPEMYTLERAVNGEYAIWARYFSSDRNRTSVRTKVHATVVQGWGTENARVHTAVFDLRDAEQNHPIGLVTVEK